MRKIYMTLAVVAAFTTTSFAQISACMLGDTVSITYDFAQNCPAAPGSLAGMAEIGFHSGANTWGSVVTWDNANAKTATNNGSDIFSVKVSHDYFGLADAASMTNVFFVFNQGPSNSAAPWGSEGKKDDGAGGCFDFSVVIADLAACASSTEDLKFEGEVTIAPNPMTDRTAILFNNTNNETFSMTIVSMMGQVVRTEKNINTNVLEIERGDLTSGVYFVNLKNEAGATITKKLIVQ